MDKSEIRKDYFIDQYVIISPNRAKRPQKILKPDVITSDTCYFCPKNLDMSHVTYQDNNDHGDWEILSIINKYPAVSLDNPKAYGQAEVIIETRQHGLDINDFSIGHIVRIFGAYIDRYVNLKKIEGIKHVIIFKNEGGKAGASIAHTHSQVIALPILPPKIKSEVEAYDRYHLENNSCPFCDIIKNENGGPRVIWQDENLFVLAPYASESPYGAWFLPKRHVRTITDLTHGEKESFAKAMKLTLGKLDEFGIPYNYFVENAIDSLDYHMHIKLAPRPNIWAGLELGTGIIINPVAPEKAAEIYRGDKEIDNDPRF
jgi:UDPglucose--hexose-1-phosphate uridylyltransferase